MKKLASILALLLLPAFALGQTGAYSGHTFVGGVPATTSGMKSSNYMDGIIPGASVTVYLTGTTTKATIYADGSNTPLSNPFFSNLTSGTNPGGFIFWAAQNQGLDIQAQGGMGNASCTTSPLCYPTATTLQVDVYPNNSISPFPLPISISIGGTGATTAAGALANLGGAPLTGTGTSGTWPISITGNAATATNVPYSGLTGTVPTWNQSTTGNAANVTGTVAIGNGGTGATTAAGANLSITGVTQTGTLGTSSQVSTFSGTVAAPTIGPMYIADAFPGADCGAKINAAVVASGGLGTIQVGAGCGYTINTPVNLISTIYGPPVALQFETSGTWVLSAPITVGAIGGHGGSLSGPPSYEGFGPVILEAAANYTATCPATAGQPAYSALICLNSLASLTNITIDGNKANQSGNVQDVLVQNSQDIKIHDATIQNASQDNIHITSDFYPGLTPGESLSLGATVLIYSAPGGLSQLYQVTVAGTGTSTYPGVPSGPCTAVLGSTCTWGGVTLENIGQQTDFSSRGTIGPNVFIFYAGRDNVFTERNTDWSFGTTVQFELAGRDNFHCEDCAGDRFVLDDFGAAGRYNFYAAVVNGGCSFGSTVGHFIGSSQFAFSGYLPGSWAGVGGDIYVNGSAATAQGFCGTPSTYSLAGGLSIVSDQFTGPISSANNTNSIQFIDAGGNNVTGNVFGGGAGAPQYNYLAVSSYSLFTGSERSPTIISSTTLNSSASTPPYLQGNPFSITPGVDHADALISNGTVTEWGDRIINGNLTVTNPNPTSQEPENYVLQDQTLTSSPWGVASTGLGVNPTITACPSCTDPFGNTGTGVYTVGFNLGGGGLGSASSVSQGLVPPSGATSGIRKVYLKSTSGTPIVILAGAPTNCATSGPIQTTWTLLTLYCSTSSISDEIAIETVGGFSPNTATVEVWDPCATYNNGQCISPSGEPLATTTAAKDYTKYTTINSGVISGDPFTSNPTPISGEQGPSPGYIQLAPAPSGAGCLYQNGSGSYSWASCENLSAALDLTAQVADVYTTLYAVPSGGGGTYHVSCYPVLTRAATSSSTLPPCIVHWVDEDTGIAQAVTITGPARTDNSVGITGLEAGSGLPGIIDIQVAPSSSILIITSGYATSGATSMQFALHAKASYVGP